VTGLRRAVLALGAAGAGTAGVIGLLPWLGAGLCAAALLAAALTRWGGPAALVGALALVAAATTQTPTPPLLVTTALLVLLLALAARRPRRSELDAACVAATGVCIVAASTGTGWAPAFPLVLDTALLVTALWHRARAAAGHQPLRPQQSVPRALIAGVAVVGALGMLALPTTGSVGLSSTLFGRHHGGGAATSYLAPGGSSTDTLSLDARGQLSDDPVLSVSVDAPQLWRGNVYATYDGHSWQVPQTRPEAAGSAPTVTGTGPNTVPVPVTSTDPVPPGASLRIVAVPAESYDGGLYAPGVVTAVAAPGRLTHPSAGGAALSTFRGTRSAYVAQVILPVTDPARLAAASGPDPAGWTQLPAELPARVRALAVAITAGARTRAAKVVAVETYLRAHERYTLDAPVPSAHEDSVDEFLFRSHEGFCEQFASAETVLLRSVGVPSRLVTGYAYGSTDAADPGRRLFTDADAHAWVEVYYPGLDWSPSDPTAGSTLAPARESAGTRLHAFLASLGRSPARRAATAGVIALVLGLGLAAVARTQRAQRRRRRARGLGPVAAAFEQLERLLPRAPSLTPREYVASLSVDLGSALEAWEAECFAAAGPSGAESRAAVRVVRAAARSSRRRRRLPRVAAPVVVGAVAVTVAMTAGPAPTHAPLRPTADPCAAPACALPLLADLSHTVVLGPRAGSLDVGPLVGLDVVYEIESPGLPATIVRSTARAEDRPPTGSVTSSTLVRGHSGSATYDPATGDHQLQWAEDGRTWTVRAPIDATAAQTGAEAAAFVAYGLTSRSSPDRP
jgi:transglutaminase-like putative cysteine protease